MAFVSSPFDQCFCTCRLKLSILVNLDVSMMNLEPSYRACIPSSKAFSFLFEARNPAGAGVDMLPTHPPLSLAHTAVFPLGERKGIQVPACLLR